MAHGHGPDPRYFDGKTPKLAKPTLWPEEPGMPGGRFYLCNTTFNGRKICWGTVIERK